MAPVKAEHAPAYGAQITGILLLAVGLGWAFGWWWALVALGVGLLIVGVAEELR